MMVSEKAAQYKFLLYIGASVVSEVLLFTLFYTSVV